MGQPGRDYLGTKTPDFADPSKEDVGGATPGIYVGTIKQINTATRNASFEVYVAAFGGDETNKSSWKTVVYASPFMGTTPAPAGDPQFNTYNYTKQSYGFYMTPPDLGNQVLCCFPPGQGTVGYWFACLSPELGKGMIPANGAVPWQQIDTASLADTAGQQLVPYLKEGTPYPAGEFNENDSKVFNANWANNKRPINPILTTQLIRQGLDTDPQRGAISSSSQRDPVSSVFGFNSPGRPLPQQDPAKDANLRQKIQSGQYKTSDFQVTGRVGGHSVVLDDGDLYGQNNLVRIKSAGGHQILMNDSAGFIYIANSEGTAWVELTKTGDILVYARNDLAIRTQGNLQLHSDRNVNINAEAAVNINSKQTSIEGSSSLVMTGGQLLNMYGGTTQLKSKSNMGIFSGASMSVRAGGKMALNAGAISLNGSGGGGEVAPPKPIPQFLSADTIGSAAGYEVKTNSIQSICYKIPTHEPYIRGSVSSVIQLQEEQANIAVTNNNAIVTINNEVVTPPAISSGGTTDQASTQPVTDPAPTSAFISQPDPGESLGKLNQDQYQAYMAQVGYNLTRSEYEPTYGGTPGITLDGYAGKYLLSSEALQTAGYLKPGTPQTAEAINNPNNWVGGPDKPANLQDFVTQTGFQETAMQEYTKANYNQLQTNGVITNSSTPQEIAGMLNASHLAGTTSATNWYTGQPTAGTNTALMAQLYQQGRYSQTQAGVITNSKAATTIIKP